jgi:protein involved in polysaccharide export with SLBB domain
MSNRCVRPARAQRKGMLSRSATAGQGQPVPATRTFASLSMRSGDRTHLGMGVAYTLLGKGGALTMHSHSEEPVQSTVVPVAESSARTAPAKRVAYLVCAAALLLAGAAGCRRSPDPANPGLPAEAGVAPIMLISGDTIEVKFYSTPELNDLQIIRPDGKIMLHLIGEVVAAGKTPIELAGAIRDLYRQQLREPTPVVLVRSFSTRRVYVVGEVIIPGAVAIPGPPLSVLEAVALAGGTNPRTAETRSVLVIRRMSDGRCRGFRVDLSGALAGQAVPMNNLQPQDIVYVPRTRIIEIDQWINQNINQIIPRLGMTYTSTSGGVTTGVNLSNGVAGP